MHATRWFAPHKEIESLRRNCPRAIIGDRQHRVSNTLWSSLEGQCRLDNSSGGGSLSAAGVWRTLGLDEQNVSFLHCDGTMLHTLRNNKYFARSQCDYLFAHLNVYAALEYQKEIVSVIVFMPNKFALDLDHH